MDGASLGALEDAVRPVAISGALTLEQAAAAIRLNRDVARFHATLAQARRIIGLAGIIDDRLREELLTRAARLAQQTEALSRDLPRRRDPQAHA